MDINALDVLRGKEVMVAASNPGVFLLTMPANREFEVTTFQTELQAITEVQSRRLLKSQPLPAAVIFAHETDDVLTSIRLMKQHRDPNIRNIGIVLLTDQPEKCKTLETLGVVTAPLLPEDRNYPNYMDLAAKSFAEQRASALA